MQAMAKGGHGWSQRPVSISASSPSVDPTDVFVLCRYAFLFVMLCKHVMELVGRMVLVEGEAQLQLQLQIRPVDASTELNMLR